MRKIFQLALIVGCLLAGAPAQALPPLGNESDGLIQSVDRNVRTVTVKIEGDSRLRNFEWNKQTQFFEHGKFAAADALKPGAAVSIRYQTPFFGKPFLTKVVFLQSRRTEMRSLRSGNKQRRK